MQLQILRAVAEWARGTAAPQDAVQSHKPRIESGAGLAILILRNLASLGFFSTFLIKQVSSKSNNKLKR